jgi:hypothetical protein
MNLFYVDRSKIIGLAAIFSIDTQTTVMAEFMFFELISCVSLCAVVV